MNTRSYASVGALSLVTGVLCSACASVQRPPVAAAPAAGPAAGAPSASAVPSAAGQKAAARDDPAAAPAEDASPRPGPGGPSDDESVELVVDGALVAHCPTLRLVRRHVDEFASDTLWLAVLESIADCMREGGPMADDTLGVSGDEDHRHVIREVLGSRGIAPTRVLSSPVTPEGAAECQGGAGCAKRVEIMLSPSF